MERTTTLGQTLQSQQWLRSTASRQNDLRRQVATGQRYELPSDAPVDAVNAMRGDRSLGRIEQLERNLTSARLWLDSSDRALTDSVSTLTAARNSAVQAANDVNTPESRAALATEVRSMIDDLVSLANTTVNGRPIFAGTSGADAAYDATGTYLGNGGSVERSVTETESFTVAPSGPAAFGTPNGADPLAGDAFQTLTALADAIELGDVAEIRRGIEQVDARMGQVQAELGRTGGLSSRLEELEARTEERRIATLAEIGEARDVDAGEAVLRLRAAEASYEATLAAVGRSFSPSLIDFLR